MVTIDQLKQWDADKLGRVADELHDRRSALTDLSDEVADGRPPASWVGGASVYAEKDHDRLANQLTDQVAELNLVISALDTASSSIRGARSALDDALGRASGAGVTVTSSGQVTDSRTYDDEDERDDAQRVVDEIAHAISDALGKAADADAALAAALGSASSTDVDAGGDLGDQALPDALRGLTTDQQVAWLLAHPDLSDVVVPSLPGPLKEALGTGLSDLLDGQVNDDDYDLDDSQVDRLDTLLDSYGSDPTVASSMYHDLGADGTVATLGSIEAYLHNSGVDPERLHELADDMRHTLSTASNAPGFDARRFGDDLTRYATYQLSDDQRDAYQDRYPSYSGSGASILTYLMQDHSLNGDLAQGVAERLDVLEHADGFMDARTWYSHNGYSPLTDGDHGGWYDDPMAAALGNLGDHPQNAYDFLTEDPGRQDFYFHDRSWEADGFTGVNQLMDGIGTDPDLLRDHPQETTEMVGRFFHGLATNDSFSVDHAQGGSPYLADLLKRYMPSVDEAVHGQAGAQVPFTAPLDREHFGSFEFYPHIAHDDLGPLMDVAVSTDDGATTIAEGIGAYQQTQVNDVAHQLAGDPDNIDYRNELRDVIQRGAGLQGYAEHAVGSVEIADAKEHDARVQAFSDLIGDAAGLVPLPGSGLAGDLLSTAWDHGVDLGTGALTDAYGNQTDAVTATAEHRAEVGATQLRINTFRTLVDAGILHDGDIPEMWRSDQGGIISVDDIPKGQLGIYADSAGDGVNGFVSSFDLEGAYKDQFLKYYGSDGD